MLRVLFEETEIIHTYVQGRGGGKEVLPYGRKSTNKCKRNSGFRIPAFGNHPPNNRVRPESSMDAKTSTWNLGCIYNLGVSPHKILINYKVTLQKGKKVTLQWRSLAQTTLTKWSKLTSAVMRQWCQCLLIQCTEENTAPSLWRYCQKHTSWMQSRGNTRRTQIQGHSTEYLARTMRKPQYHEYKEILKNCLKLKKTKQTQQLNI